MNKTIVAIYDDIVVARQVVEDLVKADFARSDISLVTNDAHNQYSHYLDKHYTPRQDAVSASDGAGFGAAVGGLTGVLVGLAALTIPGIGLAIAAGPIVAGLTGVLAGALTGGVVGALVKTGVPEDDAPYYAEGIRRGGTLISVQTSDTLHAEDIMHRHGSINIHERIDLWRQEGWKGFDAEVVDVEQPAKVIPEIRNGLPTEVTKVQVIPPVRGIDPLTVIPVMLPVEEPYIDDEDTAVSRRAVVIAPSIETSIPVTHTPDLPDEPVIVVVEKEYQSEDEDKTP